MYLTQFLSYEQLQIQLILKMVNFSKTKHITYEEIDL